MRMIRQCVWHFPATIKAQKLVNLIIPPKQGIKTMRWISRYGFCAGVMLLNFIGLFISTWVFEHYQHTYPDIKLFSFIMVLCSVFAAILGFISLLSTKDTYSRYYDYLLDLEDDKAHTISLKNKEQYNTLLEIEKLIKKAKENVV